jgi:hypothetical protein
LFGWPIREGKIQVHSINNVIINSIKYDLSIGPADTGSEEGFRKKYFTNNIIRIVCRNQNCFYQSRKLFKLVYYFTTKNKRPIIGRNDS